MSILRRISKSPAKTLDNGFKALHDLRNPTGSTSVRQVRQRLELVRLLVEADGASAAEEHAVETLLDVCWWYESDLYVCEIAVHVLSLLRLCA